MANESREHLLNKLSSKSYLFTPKPQRGKKFKIERNTDEHGRKLSQQYAESWNKSASDRKSVAEEIGFEESEGVLITFESSRQFKGLLERLDLPSRGIELRAVFYSNEKEFATVFIPDSKREHFVKSIEKFAEKAAPEGDSLYHVLENIREATIKELWTEPFPLPNENELYLWEVWLRRMDDDSEVEKLRQYCEKKQLFCYNNYIHFNDETVMLVSSTLDNLKDTVFVIPELSEIRKASQISYDFIAMSPSDNKEFIDDLIERLEVNNSNVLISILDTGIKKENPLIRPFVKDEHIKKVDNTWSDHDKDGHGTLMAGVSLYGDLAPYLENHRACQINYGLESIKIYTSDNPNKEEFIPAITEQAVAISEGDEYKRVYVLSITQEPTYCGTPSSQSAMIDKITFGYGSDSKLVIVPTGNRQELAKEIEPNYLDTVNDYPMEEPSQSWNALTVGGYTELTSVSDETFKGSEIVAEKYELSPNSRNSQSWLNKLWPIKPDVVAESGNYVNLNGEINSVDDLCVLSTSASNHHQLEAMNGTSAASAQVAKISAEILTKYNDLRAETVKGLIVHSAEWTKPMLDKVNGESSKDNIEALLRLYGYGVPNQQRALSSLQNSVTMVVEDVIIPFAEDKDKGKGGSQKTNEWKIHQLPWPKDILEKYYDVDVKLCVTLSYFVEPHPSRRGFNSKYLYNSHSLKFGLKNAEEDFDQFMARYNRQIEIEDTSSSDEGWLLGPQIRTRGLTCQKDIWEGKAGELIERNYIGVRPVGGWWKHRLRKDIKKGLWDMPTFYSLIVSIETDNTEIDLYAAIENQIEAMIKVETAIEN